MQAIDIDIRGIKQLELNVDDGGDGHWCDFAIWEDAEITYNVHQAVSITTEITSSGESLKSEDWEKISQKMELLPKLNHLAMERSEKDWLIDATNYKAEVMLEQMAKPSSFQTVLLHEFSA